MDYYYLHLRKTRILINIIDLIVLVRYLNGVDRSEHKITSQIATSLYNDNLGNPKHESVCEIKKTVVFYLH